jgi:hypothetical protein
MISLLAELRLRAPCPKSGMRPRHSVWRSHELDIDVPAMWASLDYLDSDYWHAAGFFFHNSRITQRIVPGNSLPRSQAKNAGSGRETTSGVVEHSPTLNEYSSPSAAALTSPPKQSGGKKQQRLQQREERSHRETKKTKRQGHQPNNGKENQGQQRNGPAQHEQDAPQNKKQQDFHFLNFQI